MYRVTDLDNKNEYTKDSNFYDLEEAKKDFNLKKEKGLNVTLTTIKLKVLICDTIIKHNYYGYDYYVSNNNDIDFIIQSLLLGEDHIELYKVTGTWKEPKEIINIIPVLNNDYSVESILYYCFNKIYPQSSFLSRYLVDLIYNYNDKKISKEFVIEVLENIITISFCNKQKEIVLEVISKLINSKEECND